VSVLRLAPTGELALAGCAAARTLRRAGCLAAPGLEQPVALAVSPHSGGLLVADAGGTLAVLRRSAGTRPLRGVGCLAAARAFRRSCRTVRAFLGPAGVAVSPDERWAFVAASETNALHVLRLGAGR
jgi:hypothetical protein